jgi:hypothetical protein
MAVRRSRGVTAKRLKGMAVRRPKLAEASLARELAVKLALTTAALVLAILTPAVPEQAAPGPAVLIPAALCRVNRQYLDPRRWLRLHLRLAPRMVKP